MNAKNLLFEIRAEQREIAILQKLIEELELDYLPGGIRYDRDRVQTSGGDPMANHAERMEKYEAQLHRHIDSIIKKRTKGIAIIKKLNDPTERQILELYFLSLSRMSLEDVARIVGYSRAQTYRIYRAALDKLKNDNE